MKLIVATIAKELGINQKQVTAAINLLDDGASVPFIARYRKEATDGLDDQQLRTLKVKLEYLRELFTRREVILKSLREQEQLTPELEQAINTATTKVRLEDLYLPYRPQRRTRAYIAQQAGLQPLADALLTNQELEPISQAQEYINPSAEIHDAETALQGAEQILMERFADDAEILANNRNYFWENGKIHAKELKGQSKQAYKYADYFNYAEAIKKIPSHRALALLRGRRERALQLKFVLPEACILQAKQHLADYFKINFTNSWLMQLIDNTWSIKLFPKLETEVLTRLRELADVEAIKIFSRNLRDLLLSAPAGSNVVLGLDPGIRTGIKAAVVDQTGQLLDYTVVFPLAPQYDWHESITDLAKLAAKYNVKLISIGNGTGSRETERLIKDLQKMYPDLELKPTLVSEAGASVYSASELASIELPDLDVSIRGAVSIARRLQDPLAELVKIEPKAIGVGQYQHDVNQTQLEHSLNDIVEYCVNTVGVDVNLASEALLTHISGLNSTLAKNIVEYRNTHGAFVNREQLKLVPRMGEKTYQQAAGFLRIINGENPLDASGIHPESYTIAEQILQDRKNSSELKLEKYTDSQHGILAIQEIIQELDKPNRDPRPVFKSMCFKEGIDEMSQLKIGIVLNGIVSNITNFGIFVDLGVHQDGLVHTSEMINKFNPKVGDIIKVRVINVDLNKKRISLSMKLAPKVPKPVTNITPKHEPKPKNNIIFNTTMADALSKLKHNMESQ